MGKYLLDYEKGEILDYDTIFFLNLLERKQPGGIQSPDGAANNGFDNEHGDYLFEIHDHIAYRFEVRNLITDFTDCQKTREGSVWCGAQML